MKNGDLVSVFGVARSLRDLECESVPVSPGTAGQSLAPSTHPRPVFLTWKIVVNPWPAERCHAIQVDCQRSHVISAK